MHLLYVLLNNNALQAIEEFLKSMKLTLEDMKQRPALAAAVVGYHGKSRVGGAVGDTPTPLTSAWQAPEGVF